MRTSPAKRSSSRALGLIVMPLVLSACLSTYLIVSNTKTLLEEQTNQFGQAIADHMAISIADHLVNDDRLSLNVILTELLSRNNFKFASVYNYDNELLAQVGQSTNTVVFTKYVTSQNATTGYVQLGFDERKISQQVFNTLLISLGLHLLLIIIILFLGGYYGDLFYLWMMQKKAVIETPPDKIESDDKNHVTITSSKVTFLALKLRPSRLLDRYIDKIKAAHALYGGEFELTDSGDVMICFRGPDQLSQAIYTGLLVLALFERIDAPITLKAGLHYVDDQTAHGEFEKARKHTSYLASISENQLLTSRLVNRLTQDLDQFDQQAFHSSMAPDGEVFSIASSSCKDLIESQAAQIS
ncbi:MAG: putative membrane protein affecting hemolysin expression [Candidatus Azotimanducaceae bacterium]|jgi:uncharacterized membrane protein affecting hemolysin expression